MSQTPPKVCETCGKRLVRQQTRFCSHPCFASWLRLTGARAGEKNPAWRGGFAGYRGPSWPRQKRAALERDGRVCPCGAAADITVHHIRPFVLFPDHEAANGLDNLRVLCRRCHTVADNTFWREHPELLASGRSSFPDCRFVKTCAKCGDRYEGSARSQWCARCCTFTCDQCGNVFVSRRQRPIRFCSKACNVAFRQAQRIYPHACIECGTKIRTGRYRCLKCHLADPSREVRPGRRSGRPRIDPAEA